LSDTYGGTRWWEYYAVRYLMPSVAGVAIVNWLCSHGNGNLRAILSLPPITERLDAASLLLLFLYGNLFCYVASYPILVFHATRVLDFTADRWLRARSDGYLATIILLVTSFAIARSKWFLLPILVATCFSLLQFYRLYRGLSGHVSLSICKKPVSLVFGYSFALARRRGRSQQITTERSGTNDPANRATSSPETGDDEPERISTLEKKVWHQDFMDTYRHLREHGNSAFIFILELALAALVYEAISLQGLSGERQLSRIAVIFAIWAIPAIFVHLIGQHLERRFSLYDRKVPEKSDLTSTETVLIPTHDVGNRPPARA